MISPKFTHLHVHTHYSLLDGLSKIPDLLDRVQELNMDSVAITDHGVLYGAIEFFKEAKKRNIKPIIGCEVYIALEGMKQKRPHIDDKRHHLVLLVKNATGYKNLVKLISQAHLEGFYYKPRIDEELLARHSEGLIALSACLQGKIPRLILAKKYQQAEKQALRYQEIFGPGNFYLELQDHPHIKEQQIVNQSLINIAQKHNLPLVATNDCHYLRPENARAHDILMLINTGADPNDPERLTLLASDFSLRPAAEMMESFKHVPEAIANTEKIARACEFEFELNKSILPEFNPPNNQDCFTYLKQLCERALDEYYPGQKQAEAGQRLQKELAVIKQTGFASYFLIVQDFVKWAKNNGIVVGPGRGSVAGSIVAYLLEITEIDPLKYDLLFERFLNTDRIAPPDIDLDFADTRRNEVIEYVTKKYGQDKVAQIITFGTMAARAVIRDVGRALGYSYSYCDQIAKLIPLFYTLEKTLEKVADFRQLYFEDERAKTLIDLAKQLEGVARHASTHACGVVISRQPLDNITPLQHPTQDDAAIVTQYDMYGVEDIGLLKMDFLGLKNLTIIEETLNLVEKNQSQKIDIHNLPPDDEKTFILLQKAKTTSVFQLESAGMKRYLRVLRPENFEDIMAMLALYRPGPMELIPQYIKRKHKEKKIEYLHPKLEPILKNTYGIMVYQEQLLQMAMSIAGFSALEADVLRKAVGKKIKSLLDEQHDKFIEGAIKNGTDKATAKKLWEWILPFARYGFNKSHSACYAMIAYQTAYLKAHWPVEFMTAALHSEKAEIERIAFLIEECKSMGIKVLPPSINQSEENFSVSGENEIRFGLEAIKNVGHNIVATIVAERKKNGQFKSITDFASRIASKGLNKKSMESLIKAGVFDELADRRQLLDNLDTLLLWSRDQQKQKEIGQKGLFDKTDFGGQIKLKQTRPASKKERLTWEKELLGLFVTSHPMEDFKDVIEQRALPITKIVSEMVGIGKQVRVGGVISSIKRIITKSGKPMLFVTVEDQIDKLEVIAFPSIIEKKPTLFQENKVVLVAGRVDNKDGVCKLICDDIEEIIEAEA